MYIKRHIEDKIMSSLDMFKVILITGPRQVGKTTTLKHLFQDSYDYVTLDDVNELEIAKTDPKLFFMNHPMPLIIDEVQLAPSLFTEIKRLADETEKYGQMILTGSQTFHLMENVTETLAGRIGILEFSGLSLREIVRDSFRKPFIPNKEYMTINRSSDEIEDIWEVIHRGSMPELYKKDTIDWQLYYASYVRTYIERDVRSLIEVKNLDLFSKFLISLASRTGQLVNYSQIAKDIGVNIKTIQSWTKVLETSGLVILIKPFSNNALKRIVETPMLYFLDTGLVSYLLKWLTKDTLKNGALSGQILETFVVSEIIKSFKNNGYLDIPIYFYRDKDMKEIDLIIQNSDCLYPIEIKKSASPNLSMVKNFYLLHKAIGYKVDHEIIVSLIDKKMYLNEHVLAYPIKSI